MPWGDTCCYPLLSPRRKVCRSFDPASPDATSIVNLAILTLAVTGLIFLVVEGVLLYSIWRFRQRARRARTGEPPQVYGSMPIEMAWTAAPTMIVFFLVLVTTRTLWDSGANRADAQAGDNTLFVTVIGHQWWWEYVYETFDGRTTRVHHRERTAYSGQRR